MVNIDGHDHSLEHVERDNGIECDACDQSYARDQYAGYQWYNCNGYKCLECEFTVHKRCAIVFSLTEMSEHPLHDGHCLKLLTTGAPNHTDPKCHICGKNTKRLLYHCSICNLNMDIDCMVDDIFSRAHLNLPWHYHPLVMLDVGEHILCQICGLPGEFSYCCFRCRLVVHEKCASIFDSPEITHPYHARHSLKLLTKGPPDYTNSNCHLCGRYTGSFLYHCDICKFNLDMVCANESHNQHILRPFVLSNTKVHEHTLTLIPRYFFFICDACDRIGDGSPYVCLQCNLMFFHQACARLPRVIHINRHDHRLSYRYPLGLGDRKCEVCLEVIDCSYGGYSCSLCPSYTIHSTCASGKDVWDGTELDGVPEDTDEDIESFHVNDDDTITHFSHEHKMSLNNEGIDLEESILCRACVHPISSHTFYNCSECSFILHEICARLPKKKRHFVCPRPLTLRNFDDTKTRCDACLQRCCKGFMYTDGDINIDLLCSSITVPFIHGSHPHPLLYYGKPKFSNIEQCQNCSCFGWTGFLGCFKCKYYLDIRCATLPITVRLQRYDDHPLTLCYGEKANGKYWCDICETEIDPKKWFYTCYDCGVTLHVFCVLGDIRYAKQGEKIEDGVEVMCNNTSSRPLCKNCHYRCVAPFYLLKENQLFCSYYCTLRIKMKACAISLNNVCPPWIDRWKDKCEENKACALGTTK